MLKGIGLGLVLAGLSLQPGLAQEGGQTKPRQDMTEALNEILKGIDRSATASPKRDGAPPATTSRVGVGDAGVDKISDRTRLEAQLRNGAQRIVAAPDLAGASGTTKSHGVVVLAQDLLFQREAVLTGDLGFEAHGRTDVIRAGAKMFIRTDARSGQEVHCVAQSIGVGIFNRKPTGEAAILCFNDADGDGLLETVAGGGGVSDGVYVVAKALYPVTAYKIVVTKPAGVREIPAGEGIRQKIGLEVFWKGAERKTGLHPVSVYDWIGDTEKSRKLMTDPMKIDLKPGEARTVTVNGAKVELTIVKDTLSYRIIQPMPEAAYQTERIWPNLTR